MKSKGRTVESKTGACEAPMEFEGKAPKAVSRRRVIEGAVALGVLAAFGGTVRAFGGGGGCPLPPRWAGHRWLLGQLHSLRTL